MTVTIQELQTALRRHMDAGLKVEDAIRRIGAQFPDTDDGNLRVALRGLAEEYELNEADLEAESEAHRRVEKLFDKARQETGRADMKMGEAMSYLAERGDQEAQAVLDELLSPESQAFQNDFAAAVEWHPDWTKEGKEGHYRSSPGCDLNTPEKLVTAYRKANS